MLETLGVARHVCRLALCSTYSQPLASGRGELLRQSLLITDHRPVYEIGFLKIAVRLHLHSTTDVFSSPPSPLFFN